MVYLTNDLINQIAAYHFSDGVYEASDFSVTMNMLLSVRLSFVSAIVFLVCYVALKVFMII